MSYLLSLISFLSRLPQSTAIILPFTDPIVSVSVTVENFITYEYVIVICDYPPPHIPLPPSQTAVSVASSYVAQMLPFSRLLILCEINFTPPLYF